jgi:hypothetical protein
MPLCLKDDPKSEDAKPSQVRASENLKRLVQGRPLIRTEVSEAPYMIHSPTFGSVCMLAAVISCKGHMTPLCAVPGVSNSIQPTIFAWDSDATLTWTRNCLPRSWSLQEVYAGVRSSEYLRNNEMELTITVYSRFAVYIIRSYAKSNHYWMGNLD